MMPESAIGKLNNGFVRLALRGVRFYAETLGLRIELDVVDGVDRVCVRARWFGAVACAVQGARPRPPDKDEETRYFFDIEHGNHLQRALSNA